MSQKLFQGFDLTALGKRAGWRIEREENGWRGSFAFPTAECVVSRSTGPRVLRDVEFAVAKRVKGAPECAGMHQVKWGTNIFPSDPTPLAALLRYLPSGLGIQPSADDCVPIGTLGPWTYKSTIALRDEGLVLTVIDEPAEKETPFYASLFHVDATYLGDGKVSDAFSDLRWIPFDEFIATYGHTTTCIYWQAFFMAAMYLHGDDISDNFFTQTWGPDTYILPFKQGREKHVRKSDPDIDQELHDYWDRDSGH